jgi:hypothetical protein
MQNLRNQQLKKLIQLEIKKMMDEDALFTKRKIPGDYDDDVLYFKRSHDYIDDEECSICSSETHPNNCNCPTCSDKHIGIHESCGCEALPVDYEDESIATLNHNHHDHKASSYMARPQLAKIAKYASSLLELVDEGDELEDWQESKIAQMAQMMGDVYHSLEYDSEYDDHHEDDLDMNDLIGMIRTGNI